MLDWPGYAWSEVPTPTLVAAWATVGTVPVERIPVIAAHWLVAGYDGDDLRTLAGLSGKDPYEVHDVLPGALADCGVSVPDDDSAAASVVFLHLARMHADGRASERWVLDKVDEILSGCLYLHSVLSLPLGRLYRVSDEWADGWGRTEEQLKAEIRKACAEQLATAVEGTEIP
jgi:hypothetical protein